MSDLPWLRLYTDTIDNEKLRLLAFEDRWHYIAFLCLKQQGILDSKDKLKERMIAIKLGVQIRELEEIKRRLLEVDLLDSNYQPIGWGKHQFISDSSTNRVRKYRENKKNKECNVTETLLKRKCNAIDTDTEQIQIQKEKEKPKNSRFAPPSISEVQEYCVKRENNIDPETFINFYEAREWMSGKTKIKNWKACIITWEKRQATSNEKTNTEVPWI